MRISLQTEAEVDKLVLDALEIYRLTPRCFLRAMRLCAVSSTQLAPKPMRRSSKSKSMNRIARSKWNNHDETMAKQAIRHCVTLSANELVSKLCPVEETKPGRSSPRKLQRASSQSSPGSPTVSESLAVIIPRSNSDLSTDNSTLSDLPNIATSSVAADQIVMIDLRSDEDTDGNGGGTIAKAIRLSPACLKDTNMLAKWLQHFDGIKGCVICVIDMPPVQAPEVALWRRLLLGEGDGFAPGSINYGGSYEFDGLDVSQTPRDFESPFVKLEDATIKEDAQRVGMKFVLELQKSGFPYVSLLDGGFPSLVEALFNLRGTVEPVIIQHNVEAWQQYLRYSGRGQVILPLGSGNLDGDSSDDSESVTSSNKLSSSCRGKSSLLAKSISRPQCSIKKVKDMNELERSKTAYNVAVSLKHDHMAAILKIKIMG